ncbi:MAG: GH92 family glycosyl hydrolase [Candidatus Symbiothrix sp.]|jgi:predicted alpha-1,2-mannosidase|nr:GH92 family glycosyl hydrolase [Candidatus Symbiothrix sp.]
MKKNSLTLLLTIGLMACNSPKETDVLQFVDPFIGTAYTGHTFPNATYPFGMVQPGPQTGNYDWAYCSGYVYEDSLIWGFSQTRLSGTGCPDLGDILITPFSGTPRDDFKSAFDKTTEKASPGYYGVSLTDNAVEVELTATPHVAVHRYRFSDENPAVYIDFQNGTVSNEESYHTRVLESAIQTEDNQTISGYLKVTHWVERQLYFVIKFNKPFDRETMLPADPRHKAPANIYYFDLPKDSELQAQIAFSTVSVANAKENLAAETSGKNFDAILSETQKEWASYLSRIRFEGAREQKISAYTSLYHLLIQPNNIADVNGQYRGANDSIFVAPSGKYYSTFSLWDTFRAAHPLYTIVYPEVVSDMVNSMILHADAQGFLPIWALSGKENYCMIANHAVPVVVEACLKEFPNIDSEKAYQTVKRSLTENHRNSDWTIYDKYGYYPFDLVSIESVSTTLESGYDDYCAAQLAKKLGKTDDYEFFMKRSAYYKNLFDPETKMMRGKDSKGQWRTPFNPFALSHGGSIGGDFTEGNSWQYTWHVMQDINGLADLMGGKDAFAAKLDSLFAVEAPAEDLGTVSDVTGLIGQYAQGNEPSHHAIYLFSQIGKPQRTAELVRQVFDSFYQPRPNGLCGNDDCGQMSAWYLFGAMGFYPLNPVLGEYVLGAPQLPEITIQVAENKTFKVIAKNISKDNKYVKSIRLNGQEWTQSSIDYKQIREGGVLEFEMTNEIF